MSVTRYDLEPGGEFGRNCGYMEEAAEGEWVKYDVLAAKDAIIANDARDWSEFDDALDAVPGIDKGSGDYRTPTIDKLNQVIERLAAKDAELAALRERLQRIATGLDSFTVEEICQAKAAVLAREGLADSDLPSLLEMRGMLRTPPTPAAPGSRDLSHGHHHYVDCRWMLTARHERTHRMAITGQYISRANPEVTAHALQRYTERINASGTAASVAMSFVRAELLLSVNWWADGVNSYWVDHRDRVLFVVTCDDGCLKIKTVMRAEGDSFVSNVRAMNALKALRKTWNRKDSHGTIPTSPTPRQDQDSRPGDHRGCGRAGGD